MLPHRFPQSVPALAALLAIAVASGPLFAADPRLDVYGDPLPDGAVARCGSLRFHHYALTDLVLSTDGKTVISTDRHSYAGIKNRLWDVQTGRELPLAESSRLAQIFASGGRFLAASEATPKSHDLRIRDAVTGAELGQMNSRLPYKMLAVSPDGKTAVFNLYKGLPVGNVQALLFFTDTATWQMGERVTSAVQGSILAGRFSADGKTLVTATDNPPPMPHGTVEVWNVAKRTSRTIPGVKFNFRQHLAVSPDGATLAVTDDGTKVRLWDLETLKEKLVLPGTFKCEVESLAFSSSIVAVATEMYVHLYDAKTGKKLRTVVGTDYHVHDVHFTPDGKRLALAEGDWVTMIDVATGAVVHEFGHTNAVARLAFTPDGKSLITGASPMDTHIRVWNPLTGRQMAKWAGYEGGEELRGIARLACSPDGTWVVSCSQDGTLRVWNAATGKVTRTFKPDDGIAYNMALSPDGKTVASGGFQTGVHLWNPLTGVRTTSFGDTSGAFTHLAFSPDGATLAGHNCNSTVALWHAATGKEIRTFRVDSSQWRSFAYTRDGQALVIGGEDGAIRVFDVHSGSLLRPLSMSRDLGESNTVNAVAVSPDGRTVAAAGYCDDSVRLWELVSGQERAVFKGHWSKAVAVAFSPDGSLLASGSNDRTAVVWDVAGRHTLTRPEAREFDALWADLAKDGKASFKAVQRLALVGDAAVAFLKSRIKPAVAPDSKGLAALVADLENPKFAVREKASATLAELNETAEPSLRDALDGTPSPELRRRAQALVERIDLARSPALLRDLRAVEVLEHIATPDARALLRDLAAGAETVRVTRDAKAALGRLGR